MKSNAIGARQQLPEELRTSQPFSGTIKQLGVLDGKSEPVHQGNREKYFQGYFRARLVFLAAFLGAFFLEDFVVFFTLMSSGRFD